MIAILESLLPEISLPCEWIMLVTGSACALIVLTTSHLSDQT